MTKSPVSLNVNLDGAGKRSGLYWLSHRTNESAYKRVMAPIGIISNGTGPTALLMAGTHGDEYAGQLAVRNVFNALKDSDVRGRIIFLPSANIQAAQAGLAFSPTDNQNLMRAYDANNSSITGKLAHFYETVLFPQSDLVMDLHSGGKSLRYLPGSLIMQDPDPEKFEKQVFYSSQFGAPVRYISASHPDVASFPQAAQRAGAVHMSAELGGSLYASPEDVQIGVRGIYNVLASMGILPGKHLCSPCSSDFLMLSGGTQRGYAQDFGLLELTVPLGAKVKRGQLLARLHADARQLQKAEKLRSETNGILVSVRANMRVETGDCLWEVASPVLYKAGKLVPL